MNEQIRNILEERSLDFAESIGAPLEIHEDQYYVYTAAICSYLGFNRSNISRPFRDHYDLGKQLQRGHWYVRADFIPWWLMRLSGGHNLSYEIVERIRGILQEKFGIPTPKRQWYIYFYEVEETGNIKIGLTSNYISGTRTAQLKKTYGEGRYLGALKNSTDQEEKRLQKMFAHLCVDVDETKELFRPGGTLRGYIEAAKESDRWTPVTN